MAERPISRKRHPISWLAGRLIALLMADGHPNSRVSLQYRRFRETRFLVYVDEKVPNHGPILLTRTQVEGMIEYLTESTRVGQLREMRGDPNTKAQP